MTVRNVARDVVQSPAQSVSGIKRDGEQAPVTYDYLVVLLAGQSNMVGRGTPIDGTLDATDSDILQLNTNAGAGTATSLVTAQDPLNHWDAGANTVGMGLTYAKQLLAAAQVDNPDQKIVLVPAAKGATGFSGSGGWNVGDDQYDEAIARANKAMELCQALGTVKFHSILWHQLEKDLSQTSAFYESHLDNCIARMRNEITGASNSTPFICGDVDESVGTFAARTSLTNTPSRVPFSAFVTTVGLTDIGDNVHFSTTAQRTLGEDYHDALSSLSGSLSISAPNAVTDLTATAAGAGEAVDLTWTAPSNGGDAIVNYIIEYKLASDSDWSEFLHAGGTSATASATVNSLTASSEYDFRIYAVNSAGVGGVSNEDSATPTASVLRPAISTILSGVYIDFGSRNETCTDGVSQTITNLADAGSQGDAWNGSGSGTDGFECPFAGTAGESDAVWDFDDSDQRLTMKAASTFTNNLHRSDSTQDWTLVMQFKPGYTFKALAATAAHGVNAGIIFWVKNYGLRIRIYGTTGSVTTPLDSTSGGLTLNTTGIFCFSYNATTRAYGYKVYGGTHETGTLSSWTNTVANTKPMTIFTDTGGAFGSTSPSEGRDFALLPFTTTEANMDSIMSALAV